VITGQTKVVGQTPREGLKNQNDAFAQTCEGELMSEAERALEKRLKNLALEIQTIDVLIGHALADLRGPVNPAHLNAARRLCETIQVLTATYK
jgi:hypothetical protein